MQHAAFHDLGTLGRGEGGPHQRLGEVGRGCDADQPRDPLGPRAPTGGKLDEVSRTFASGTRVTVQLSGAACAIAWADGATTTCA
jgi:hypothetical protein